MKRLLLFETAPQIKKLLSHYAADDPGNIWVALSPEADYAAECAGLTYRQVEEFYDETKLIALGIENYRTVGDFCDTVDRLLQDYLCDIPEIKYISTHQAFHSWKTLFDAIIDRTFALKAVVEAVSPDEIVSFRDVTIERRDGFTFSSGSAFRSVLPVVAGYYDIKLTQIPATLLDWQSLTGWRQKAAWLVHRLPGGVYIATRLTWLKRKRPEKIPAEPDKGQPTLVAADAGHDVDLVVERWRAENAGPVIMLGDVFGSYKAPTPEKRLLKKKLNEMWYSEECQQKLAPFFNINEFDCYPVVRPRLHFYFSRFLPRSLEWASFVRQVLENTSRSVVLSNLEPVACEVARQLGIPSVTHQHGGLCGYAEAPIYEHMELYPGDYFFCYGEGIVRFLEKPVASAYRSTEKHRARPVAVGSAALDSIAQVKVGTPPNYPPNQTRKSRKVIYAPSSLMGDWRHHTYHSHPDIWYWRLEQEAIKIFGRFPDIKCIAKLYPREFTTNPLDDWFRQNTLPNVKIVRDLPFTDFLNDADLFIIDCPTTTLVQAVPTNKKIILYTDRAFFRLDPRALELLKKRVVFSDSKEQFLEDIERVLGEDDWTLPEPVNDEFLKGYGTHLNDGRSAERAVRVLVDLAIKNG